MTASYKVACAGVSSYSTCTNVRVSLQVENARRLGMDPTNWVRYMLEVEYPLIDDYTGDHAEVVELFHRRFPNAPIPYIGAAAWDIQYSSPMFDNQDAWRETELANQRTRYSLTDDRDFIIAGLGLPFERLYFEARAQLRYAVNELKRYRLRDAFTRRDELLREFRRTGRSRSSP